MEKKKPINDPMMAVKAAAWAWYQHGSGSDLSNTAREYDATRRRHGPPKPSRYKLEAMRAPSSSSLAHKNATTIIEPTQSRKQGGDSLSLLDDYEIRRISRQLDSFIENSNSRENYASSSDDESFASGSSSSVSAATKIRRSMKRMLMRGFWMRHAATVCGVRESTAGVVATATVRVFRDTRGVATVTRRF